MVSIKMTPILWLSLAVAIAELSFMLWIILDEIRYPWWFYAMGYVFKYKNYIGSPKNIDWNFSRLNDTKAVGPNIIFIIVDDMGINDISGGNHGVSTPNIDSIFQNGVKFTNSYAGHATCAPARAAMFTGRYPTRYGYEYTPVPPQFSYLIQNAKTNKHDPTYIRTGIYHEQILPLIPPVEEMVVPLNETFISQKLKAVGYDTAYIGKWHLGEIPGALPEDRGFDKFVGFLPAGALYAPLGDASVVEAYVLGESTDDMIRVFGSYVVRDHLNNRFYPKEYMTDYFAHQAVEALNGHAAPRLRCLNQNSVAAVDRAKCDEVSAPLFLTVSFNAPHNPYQALVADYNDPEVIHIQNHRQRVYAAMMKSLDRAVGEILDAVVHNDMFDNTLIIFTSDNGGLTYTNLKDVNTPYRGGKGTFFEGGIRVPLLMQWPAVIPPKRECTSSFSSVNNNNNNNVKCEAILSYDPIVSHVDIFSTIEAAAGIRQQQTNLDGVDLMPFLKDSLQSTSTSEEAEGTTAVTTTKIPHQYLYWRSGHYIGLRWHNWKLQFSQRPHKIWLFDLLNDPTERFNLAEDISPAGLDWLLVSQSSSSSETNNRALPDQHKVNFSKTAITKEQTYSTFINYVSAKEFPGTVQHLDDQCMSHAKASLQSGHNATIIDYIASKYPSLSVPAANAIDSEVDSDLLSVLCKLINKIVATHTTEMVAPIWPSLSEGLIAIDMYYVQTLEDEYIYWPN